MLKEIKRKLMMRDERQQISAVGEIHNALFNVENNEKAEVIEQLLRFNVGNILCDVLGTCNQELLTLVSECLSMLCTRKNFYTNNIAHLAVDKILKTSYLLLNKREKYGKVILEIIFTLKTIFVGAEKLHIPLCSFCDPSRILNFLIDLRAVESTDVKLKMTSVRIFKRILHFSQVPEDEKKMALLGRIIEDHLESMQQVIEAQTNSRDPIVQTAMKHVSTMCCETVRLCETIQNTHHYGINFPAAPKTLHDSLKFGLITLTTKSLTNSLIPHLKHLNRATEASRSILMDFLTCLNTLYNLDDLDPSELSRSLAIEGYLMFLYQEGLKKKEQVNSSISLISRILSKILTNLAIREGSLGIQETPDANAEYQGLLCRGLLTSMEANPAASSEFLTLIYFHHKATNEEINIPLEQIIARILAASVDDLEPPAVKILWFFTSKLMMRGGEKPRELSEAVFKLFEVVKELGVDKCFLDDAEVVKGVLAHPLGDRIRLRVLEMWVEVHEHVEDLWNGFTEDNLVLSLWQLMRMTSRKIVEKVRKSLEVLIHDKERIERNMRKILLESLPEILAECETENCHNLTSILQLCKFVGCGEFPEDFGILCAPNITRILTEKFIDLNLKILIISFVIEVFNYCVKKRDPRIAIILINKSEVIEELKNQAFNSENDEFSGVCLKILTILLMSQKEFNLVSEKRLIVEEHQLYAPLERTEAVWLEHMPFLLIILSEFVDKPILKIGEFSSEDKRDEIIYGIYEGAMTLHERSRPDQWPTVYQLMTTLLGFCKRRNLKRTLHHCLDCPGHFFLVFGAILHNDTCEEFFNFIINWIRISIESFTQNVEYEFSSIEKRKKKQWAPFLQFGRTLSMIDNYLNTLRTSKKIEENILEDLMALVSGEIHENSFYKNRIEEN